MRHIFIDYARSEHSEKRGGWQDKITLNDSFAVSNNSSNEIVALDDALKSLEQIDNSQSRVVEMNFFGGLTIEEIAEVLKVSPETVKRDWKFARTWLLRELDGAKKSKDEN